jgi:catechol 2,3-dioxygenase-like lactoylglutathione lyase family enzyme
MSVPLTRREFVAALAVPPVAAAVGAARGVAAQSSPSPAFRVNGLSHITLTVSDVKRSLDFYQGLFGMPIQARQGSSVLLRIGNGPRFLALRPAAAGEKPSISAFGFGVRDFNLDRAVATLAGRGVSAVAAGAPRPGPKQALVRVRRPDEGGSADGSTRELFVADPSGIVFQLHDVSYCGGSGAQGNVCAVVEPSPARGVIALKDTSHFTIAASDPTTVPFYLDLFGFKPTAFQAQTPSWGVGDGVHFLMFIGGGGPTRADFGGAPAAGGAPRAGGPGAGGPPAGRAGGGPPPARAAAIDHCCVAMDNFDPAAVTKILTDFGLKQQEGQARTPLVTYISLRMPNRGGAEGGTPELYLTDPDGLAVQLQDVKYCGGGGFLGELCPALP